MRKCFCILLAVLTLLFALPLSVGAEVSTFDKSVKTDADGMDLVVTEVMVDSITGIDGYTSHDAYEYIELYNRGDTAIDLAQLSILMCNNYGNTADSNVWLANHKFTNKVNLVSGDVYNDAALASSIVSNHSDAWPVSNPSNCLLEPGKFAIIWFWNNDCNALSEYLGESLAEPDDTRPGVFFPKFRDFFASEEGGSEQAIPDDVLIMVAMGATTIAGNYAANPVGFNLSNSGNRMYAIADKNFDINTEGALTSTGTINTKIKCMFQWGYGFKSGIPQVAAEQLTTIYVPSDAEPYVFNRDQVLNQEEGKTPLYYSDYAKKDAALNYEVSYNEVSVMAYWESPTPGYMMPYQWIYVQKDESKIPDSAKMYTFDGNADGILDKGETVNANWKTDALAALEKAKILVGDDLINNEFIRDETSFLDIRKFLAYVSDAETAESREKQYAAICGALSVYNNSSKAYQVRCSDAYEKLQTIIAGYNATTALYNGRLEAAVDSIAALFPSSVTAYGQLNSVWQTRRTFRTLLTGGRGQ